LNPDLTDKMVGGPQKTTFPDSARRLGLATAIALLVGETIGMGIFLTPAEMAKTLGSPFWLLFVWSMMGACSISGALCIGALAARYPQAGGPYAYLREAYGPRSAFLYGWLSLLVTDPGLTAALAVGLARYVGHLVSLSPWWQMAAAIGAIVVTAATSMAHVALASRVVGALAALKLGLLAFIVVWGFALGGGNWSNFSPFWSQRPGSDPLLAAIAGGLIMSFFSFGGWWDASKLAGELRNPERTLPLALVLGIGVVTAVYVAINAVFLYLVPPTQIASDEVFAALAGQALFGRAGEIVFSCVVVICIAGQLAAVFIAFPRVYYAMARDRLFFQSFATVDPSRGTPARAVALQAALAVVFVLTGSFDQIITYFMVPTILFLGFTVTATFVLHRGSAARPPLSTPDYPVSPAVFVALILVLVFLLVLNRPLESSIGLLVVLLGIPISGRIVSRARSPMVDGTKVPAGSASDFGSPTTELPDVHTIESNLPT
jgi:basic amino acid/polyamine antiporter, APA family